MDISVIMPSLNVAKYMGDCLRSVTRQSLIDLEIICVDAGSTDGTREIIEKIASDDKRIRIIDSPVKSYGYQMNLGLDAATGEYIAIVETDDYIDENMFATMYNQARTENVDFVKGGFTGFFEGKRVFEKKYLDVTDKDYVGRRIDLNSDRAAGILSPVHIWSGIYRRSFLVNKGIRFNETPGASFQDTSFSILVGMLADSCMYTTDCFYHYRMDNANSSVKSDKKVACVIEEYKFIEEKLRSDNKYTDEIESIVQRYKLCTYNWNYERLNEEGRKEFISLIKEEMQQFVSGRTDWKLTDDEKRMIDNLTSEALIPINIKREEALLKKTDEFVRSCMAGERFNIVGAGRFLERFLVLEDVLGINFIESVSDNSEKLHHTHKKCFEIMPVEEAVAGNRSGNWLIASRYHAYEIHNQLTGLGVNKDKITVFDSMPAFEALTRYLYFK